MPDGKATETNPDIMGVASQSAATTGRFVVELEAQSEAEGQDELDKSLAIVEGLEVGGLSLLCRSPLRGMIMPGL
jgi:hypothetical protein